MKHPMLKIEAVSDELYEVSDLLVERFSKKRLWLWDLEATGLDTNRERVTQIAGILFEDGRLVEESAFTQFVFPGEGVEIPKVVRDLTGITLDMLKDAPTLPEAWAMHMEAAQRGEIWIGQSVFEFDVPLLHSEFQRHGMPDELPPILDSVVMATHLLGALENSERWSTSKLLKHYEDNIEGLRRHDALDDVKILGRILKPMLEQYLVERDDLLDIPSDRPMGVRRHAPIDSSKE